jgi:PAS domain S-box-containing protein
LDRGGTVVDANRKVTDWLGYEVAEVVGKNIADLPFAPTKDKTKSRVALSRRFRGEAVPPYVVTIFTKNGEERRARVRGEILKNEKGEPIVDLVMITVLEDAPTSINDPEQKTTP